MSIRSIFLCILITHSIYFHAENSIDFMLRTITVYKLLQETASHDHTDEDKHDHDTDASEESPLVKIQKALNTLVFVPIANDHYIISLQDDKEANQQTITHDIVTINLQIEGLAKTHPDAQLLISIQDISEKQPMPISNIVTIFKKARAVDRSAQKKAIETITEKLGNLKIHADGTISIPETPTGFTLRSGKLSKESSEKIIEAIEQAQQVGVVMVTHDTITIALATLKDAIAQNTFSAPKTPPHVDPKTLQYTSAGANDAMDKSILTAIAYSDLLAHMFGMLHIGIHIPTQNNLLYPTTIYTPQVRVQLWQRFLQHHVIINTATKISTYQFIIPDACKDQFEKATIASFSLHSFTINLSVNDLPIELNLGTCLNSIQKINPHYDIPPKLPASFYLSSIKTAVLLNNEALFKSTLKVYIAHLCKFYQNIRYFITTKDKKSLKTTKNGRLLEQVLKQAQELFGNITVPLNRENKSNNKIAQRDESVTLNDILSYIAR